MTSEDAQHDRAIAAYSESLLASTFADLGSRRAFNRRDPEQRWVMARRAAIARRLIRIRAQYA